MYVVTLPSSADPATFALKAKQSGADILEIRGDITPEVTAFDSSLPLLVSPRGKDQKWAKQFEPTYIDLEITEIDAWNTEPRNWQLVISHHNYDETRSVVELQANVDRMIKHAPDIIKIATNIQSYKDLLTLESVQKYIPSTQKNIVLGMGTKAHLNRTLSTKRNEFTYTFLEQGQQAAKGQISLEQYKRLPKTNEPKIFGIIGGMDIQSKSPLIHNTLCKKYEVDALYCQCLTDDLDDLWQHKMALGMYGFSVTSPYKQEIMPKLDELSDDSAELGTVNTVVLEGTKWKGYPRDSEGLIRGYDFLKTAKSIAILGSGGVVPSVIHACKKTSNAPITIFARNQDARTTLSQKFQCNNADISTVSSSECDVIICTISQDVEIELPKTDSQNKYALDLRYGKETQFLKTAKEYGFQVSDGLPMLIYQALAQFELFTGIKTDEEDATLLHSLLTNGK